MRVLLVGAGAIGQVYAWHFARAGADVAFLVREPYAQEARRGFDLYPLNGRAPRRRPVHFDGFEVFTDVAKLGETRWDCVVICVSSTALRHGTWFEELTGAVGEAAVLSLTPGLEDKAFISKHVPASRAVYGLIGLLSYHGPLPGEELPKPGMVFWVPPLTKMAFSGAPGPTMAIVELLNRGGLNSKQVADTSVNTAFAGPVLNLHMVALELAGWSFAALRRDKPLLRAAFGAMREAFVIAEKRFGQRTPLPLRMLRPWMMRLALALLPRLAPLNMERFFEVHFTKVRDQTQDTLATYARLGATLGVKHTGLDALQARMAAASTP